MAVFFDVVRRYLGGELHRIEIDYVQNITDVDDKIIQAAKELNVPEMEIADKYTKAYNEDLASLLVRPPTKQPRVSEHIPQIISFIEGLIEKGYAYEVKGDVYYRVKKFTEYGKLSNQTVDSLQHTEREVVHMVDYKECEHDFALWKAQKADEIAWESPWGKGRPGWHIECSAMSKEYLGESFDIHGGGMDLCFPHHENEIAQSEALSGRPLARFWMHNNYVTVEGQKMSKSLGNFTTVRDALKDYKGEEIRYFFLTVNYRNPIDYSQDALEQAKKELAKIQTLVSNLQFLKSNLPVDYTVQTDFEEMNSKALSRILQPLRHDFDTSNTLSELLSYVKTINQWLDKEPLTLPSITASLNVFQRVDKVLGLNLVSSDEDFQLERSVQVLIQQREDLRKRAGETSDLVEKRMLFQHADKLREEAIQLFNVLLEDTPNGVRWKNIKNK